MLKPVRLVLFLTVMIISPPALGSDYIENMIPGAAPVGTGRLTIFFMDVYDLKLYAAKGVWKPGSPLALEFRYLRNIKGTRIAQITIEEIRKLGFRDELLLAGWYEQIRKIFPDVKEGVMLTGIFTDDEETVFYKDGEEIGRVKDTAFGNAFFNIWLDPKTREPGLRKKLLGLR